MSEGIFQFNESRRKQATQAAETIQKSMRPSSQALSIADVTAKSGLSFRDAEAGLYQLVSEFRGHLAATSTGELLFSFPTGFRKPWEKITRLNNAVTATKKFLLGVGKFCVRAWISVVMIGYVVAFALILLALATSKGDNDRNRGSSFGGSMLFSTLLRVILDSLFWTFHPFSPFYVGNRNPYGMRQPRANKVPFYERVNSFVFGPEQAPPDPLAFKKTVIAEIRAKQGRISLADVMRITGLEKSGADPLVAELMVDYDGEVSVSDEGGIIYTFADLRKTAGAISVTAPAPIWSQRETVLPVTGNPAGTNMMVMGLNGFNFIVSMVAISGGWTVEKIQWLLAHRGGHIPLELIPPAPVGTPWVLGWIPFIFSAAIFAFPVMRALGKGREKRKVNRENGRRGILRLLLSTSNLMAVPESQLRDAYMANAGVAPSDRELSREIVKLGGDIDVRDDGSIYYRFEDLNNDTRAVVKERRAARQDETLVGDVVFSSQR